MDVESGGVSSVSYDCNLDAVSPVDVLASIQSRVTESADRHMTSRSLGLREMMRCATSAAARAVSAIDSRIGGGLDTRSAAAAVGGGVDPRLGPSVSEVRPGGGMIPLGYSAGMESRLDPRTGLEMRTGGGMDSRSVGGMESRSVGLGVEMREAVADREEVVISTLSWPPDQPDTINQGQFNLTHSIVLMLVSTILLSQLCLLGIFLLSLSWIV